MNPNIIQIQNAVKEKKAILFSTINGEQICSVIDYAKQTLNGLVLVRINGAKGQETHYLKPSLTPRQREVLSSYGE